MTTSLRELPSIDAGAVPEWTQGDRLRRALRHANISVADMAETLDVSAATLSRWLNDKGPIKRVYLQVWADLTGVSEKWLEMGEYAMRDLNPQPADYESGALAPVVRLFPGPRIARPRPRPASVKALFTVDRLAA